MHGIKNLLVVRVGCLLISFSAVGQSEKFTIPEKLSQTVNTALEETLPVLSPGGDTLYFTRFNLNRKNTEPVKGHDIWYAVKQNNTWSEAKNDLLNLEDFNSVVGISADGHTLFLLKYEGKTYSSIAGIAYSEKIDGKWQAPQPWNVHEIFTANSFFGFFLNRAENILIISMKGVNSLGKEDLYVSFKNENQTWSAPRHMGPVINTRGFEISPFLCDDNRTLYFASNGHGGFGDADIFVTHRLDDHWNNWSEPENLGKPVNSSRFDGYFTRYNNHDIFFVSNRNGPFTDIYHTSVADENSENPMLAANNLASSQGTEDKSNGNAESKVSKSLKTQNESDSKKNISSGKGPQDVSAGRNTNVEVGKEGMNNGNELSKFNENKRKDSHSKNQENGEYDVADKTSNNQDENGLYKEKLNENDKNTGAETGYPPSDAATTHMITGTVIYFGFDNFTLTRAAQADLLKIIKNLKHQKNYRVDLVGYTDQMGSERYNLKLSEKRAKAARDFLLANGLDKAMITDEGKGIYRELSTDLGEEGRQLQRRVDILYGVIAEE